IGGVASGTTVSSGGVQIVSEDLNGTFGSAIGTVVGSSGTLIVSSGGIASGAILNDLAAVQIISLGGIAIGTVVSSGGQAIVSSGTASGTVVSSGGSAVIFAGGTASATVILTDGSEVVSLGGLDISGTLSGSETVFGTVSSATIGNGGSLTVSSGAT